MTQPRRSAPRAAGFLAVAALSSAACDTPTSGGLDTFAGEWCSLRGLGTNDQPLPGIGYIAMTLIMDGDGRLLGSGATSPPTTDSIYPARYRGDLLPDGRGRIDVSDLDEDTETPGPVFTMELTRDGTRDLVGTASGHPGFSGSVHLVRLGPRCFAD